MIEKVREDPISSKMLAIDGKDIMDIAKLNPSPKVGQILDVLLDEVLEDPKRNEAVYLKERVAELANMSEAELSALQNRAKNHKEEFERGVEEEMKNRYYVK